MQIKSKAACVARQCFCKVSGLLKMFTARNNPQSIGEKKRKMIFLFSSFTTGKSYSDHLNTYHELASITMLNEGETIQEKVTNVLRCVHKFPPAALLVSEQF